MTSLAEQGRCQGCGGPGPLIDGAPDQWCATCDERAASNDAVAAQVSIDVLEAAIRGAIRGAHLHPSDLRKLVERVIDDTRPQGGVDRTFDEAVAVERRYAHERQERRALGEDAD